MSRAVVHFDVIPCPGEQRDTPIILACGHDWSDLPDVSTDPDEVTCPACVMASAFERWKTTRPIHLDLEPSRPDAEPGTVGIRLACERPYLQQFGMEWEPREVTQDRNDVTCPDCAWFVRREREAAGLQLPPHYWRRYPVDVGELARAMRNVCRPHWCVDLRLGAHGCLACEPADADALVAHYHAELVAEGVIGGSHEQSSP